MCNEILIKDTSLTVTFHSDSPIPNNDYGKEIAVQVNIDTSGWAENAKDTITIMIGEHRFLRSEVEHWAEMIKRAEMIAESIEQK